MGHVDGGLDAAAGDHGVNEFQDDLLISPGQLLDFAEPVKQHQVLDWRFLGRSARLAEEKGVKRDLNFSIFQFFRDRQFF